MNVSIVRVLRGFALAILFLAICTHGNDETENRKVADDWVDLYESYTHSGMPYRLMKPLNFDPEEIYPVVVSLHGGGGRGTDNRKQLRAWNKLLAEEQRRTDYPCYVLAPQANSLWNATHLQKVKDIVKDLPSVDMNRIYILGHSMGGHGTYILIQIDPGYFAAAAPSAGSGLRRTEEFIDASVIKDIPIWAFHGDKDKVCPIERDQKLFAEMERLGGNMKLTTWAGDGHGVAEKMITGGDNDSTQLSSDRCDPEPSFLKWLFAQRLRNRKQQERPREQNKGAGVLEKDNVAPRGFRALFNGKDFTGWKARQRGTDSEAERAKWQQNWKVEAGIIKFDGKGPTLWTTKKFKDFVLMVDWRFPKPGDSGIYLRGRSKSQVNIWCNEMGSGEVWGYRTDKKLSGEIRKACTPLKKMDKLVGKWNRFVITIKGDRLTVKLNGEVVIKNAQLPGVPAKGEIALQQHGNPIEFRNIYIKSLESALKPTDDPPMGTDSRVLAVIDELEKSCIKRKIRILAPEKAQRLTELLRQAKPRAVVECGTAVGYASLWIARELKAAGRGKLTTIEIVPSLAREAEANIRKAGLEDFVIVRVGDARKLVKELKGPIDLVLLDCLPQNYHACFIGLEDKLEDGAIVVADNAGYGARGMANYLKLVRAKYKSTTEWFDIDLPWAKRDAIEVTVVRRSEGTQK